MSVHLNEVSREYLSSLEDYSMRTKEGGGSLSVDPSILGSVPPPQKKFQNPNRKKHRKHGKMRKEPEAFAEAPRTSPGR